MLPLSIELWRFNVPTIYFFIFAAFTVFGFSLWSKGKREGFDEEKLFDLVFITILIFILGSRFDVLYAAGVSIIVVFILSYLWKWSAFRLLDLYILSALAGSTLALLGLMLLEKSWFATLANGLILFVYLAFVGIRNRFKSGYTFSLILLFGVSVGYLLEKSPKYLIFYGYLIIIALVNIYLRERKSMANTIFPIEFVNRLKNELLSKRKRLKAEQKILVQEDPYMQDGRENDNAETMDDVMLEDQPKREQELRKSALEKAQIQVRKALARMKLGKYGYCEVCGEPIDKARLEAYPEATTCLKHAPNA